MENPRSIVIKGEQNEPGGTGSGFGRIVLILAGVSVLIACLLTLVSTFLQTKNYRKPLLQRHVIRIFMLVPIFGAASFASLTSLRVAFWVDPFRDVYEAFTLYTFFQLLVNFLGGERSLIILMHGRRPVEHLWPMNLVLDKVDISDPHTFLSIKRGILQYVWIKPLLAIATVAMKATSTFKEGVISVSSGYLWTSLIYNVSICWALYDLALFWVCMSADMQPFRPMPKFLCIKGIIFASWWQGFFLSVFVWLGAITSAGGDYTADNLAAAIQDALICFEMPLFAVSHWYAFSWKDYSDSTISEARMPIRYALRDAFGPRDLIEDAKETFRGGKYEYRHFDAGDNVIAHEESRSRQRRMQEGMRYERNGRGKYWIPKPGGADPKQPLLSKLGDNHARTMSPGNAKGSRDSSRAKTYGTAHEEPEEPELDETEEKLYKKAREMEFGDWHYPVINTRYANRDDAVNAEPNMLSSSTNRAVLQPASKANKERRKSRIQHIQEGAHQGDDPSHRNGSSSSGDGSHAGGKGKDKESSIVPSFLRQKSSDSSSSKGSHSSQLVDLVVEDTEAQEVERVRARKEGGPGWNSVEQKHFVQTYPESEQVEEVRQGFNPDKAETKAVDQNHTTAEAVGEGVGDEVTEGVNDVEGTDQVGQHQPWDHRDYDKSPFEDEREVWGVK